MKNNTYRWQNAASFCRRALVTSVLCLLMLAAAVCFSRPASAQFTDFYLNDYHFRAGDGGQSANTAHDSTNKAWGTPQDLMPSMPGMFIIYQPWWIPGVIAPEAMPFTDIGSGTGGTFSGSAMLGDQAGAFDGRVTLEVGQASASPNRGGDVVINLPEGQVISNPTATNTARRYIFTAGDGNAGGDGGNIRFTGTDFTLGAYSAFIFQSGAGGGGQKGGEVFFSADTLHLGQHGDGSLLFFEQIAGGGQIEARIGDLYVTSDSAISYKGTSARYNTIEKNHFGVQSTLTLLGKAGNRYNDQAPHEFNYGNYTADGAHIRVDTDRGGSYPAPAYLNIQAGKISASSIDFMQLHDAFKLNSDGSVSQAALYINNPNNVAPAGVTPQNPALPELLDGETSLGVLDLTGIDKNNIYFNYVNAEPGDTYCLIKGNWGDKGAYLLGDDYGVFARQFGAQRYLFDLDASNGDMLLTFMGLDGGYTHYIKSYFEGRAAEGTTVIASGQFVADSVIANARLKARLNETTSSLSIGTSKIKTKTGSYVENDNYNAAISGAYLFELGPGEMLFGAFFEAGRGQYDYFHKYNPAAPQDNDGKSDYYGGGAFARYEFPIYQWDDFYVEASIRTGKIDNKFNGMFGVENVTYKNHSSYYGGHFGLGKIFNLTERTGLDLYAKGFYNAVESGGVMTSAKENLDFDRIESVTTRVGGRLVHQFTDQFVAYVGGSWEKEYNGRVDGTYLGKDYDFGTSLKGDSALGEIGFNLQPSYLPLEVELSAFGKGGQQEGFGGSLSLKYSY